MNTDYRHDMSILKRISETPWIEKHFLKNEKVIVLSKLSNIVYENSPEANIDLYFMTTGKDMIIIEAIEAMLIELFSHGLKFKEFPRLNLHISDRNVFLIKRDIGRVLEITEDIDISSYKSEVTRWIYSFIGISIRNTSSKPYQIPSWAIVISKSDINNSKGSSMIHRAIYNSEEVAVKTYRENSYDNRNRILQEAEVLLTLNHPSIVRCFGVVEIEGTLGLVTEYCIHGSVDKIETASVDEKIVWINKVIDGLDYIHAKNIVHLGIEPSSILINSERNPKISDFRFASLLPAKGGIVKSLNYAAPEALMRNVKNCTADHWSFGMTLFQIFYGSEPFIDESRTYSTKHFAFLLFKNRIRLEFPNELSIHGQRIDQLIHGLLNSNPEERSNLPKLY